MTRKQERRKTEALDRRVSFSRRKLEQTKEARAMAKCEWALSCLGLLVSGAYFGYYLSTMGVR